MCLVKTRSATRQRHPDLCTASVGAVANRSCRVHAEDGALRGALRDVEGKAHLSTGFRRLLHAVHSAGARRAQVPRIPRSMPKSAIERRVQNSTQTPQSICNLGTSESPKPGPRCRSAARRGGAGPASMALSGNAHLPNSWESMNHPFEQMQESSPTVPPVTFSPQIAVQWHLQAFALPAEVEVQTVVAKSPKPTTANTPREVWTVWRTPGIFPATPKTHLGSSVEKACGEGCLMGLRSNLTRSCVFWTLHCTRSP